MAEFKAFFGGLKEWNAASKAAQSAVQTQDASKTPSKTSTKKSGVSNPKAQIGSQEPSHGSTTLQ